MQTSLDRLYQEFLDSAGVFTDTRSPVDGGIFFALSGPNFNGNKFATQAIASGAKLAVIDDEAFAESDQFILVDDSLATLQRLANYHRSQFKGPVFALTGSNGKTTTKELISTVLETTYQIVATAGNFNNHIGVPLTLLRITEETEIAVIEMGANHVGEIKVLSEIADPSHGLITNIGKAHLEGFGSYEGIRRGKGELYDHLRNKGGQVFINSSDAVLREMSNVFEDPLYFPNRGDFYECEMISADPFVSIRTGMGSVVNTQLIGEYNFTNAATALCLGQYFDVPSDKAEKAVAEYIPSMNRSEVIEKGSNVIVLDAYNANPNSMEAAVENLKAIDAENKVAILGDMLELGDTAEEEHRRLGDLVREANLTDAYFCGELVKYSAEQVPNSHYFTTKEALAAQLQKDKISNSHILVKASRGVGLETLMGVL